MQKPYLAVWSWRVFLYPTERRAEAKAALPFFINPFTRFFPFFALLSNFAPVMSITSIIRPFFGGRVRAIEQFDSQAEAIQRGVLSKLISRAADTELGQSLSICLLARLRRLCCQGACQHV